MRHFYRWICGYICVCLKGRQIFRFLNLCSKNGIHLWRINYDFNQSIRANLRLRDFYDLKPYLRKTKTRLKIISKKGFPFWCYRHPKTKWFLGLVFCLMCIGFYCLNFVWNIEIKGNTKISKDEIIQCLQENNIDIGVKKEKVDCSKIELLLREQFHEIGWVSVYYNHFNLCIDVKESLYDVFEEEQKEEKPYHIIANKDATISSIITRSGKALVKKGEKVRKNTLLVLGQNDIFDDNGEVKETLYFKADAEIYGDILYDFPIPLTEMEVLSLKITNNYNEKALIRLGNQKLDVIINKMKNHGIFVLNKNIILEKTENKICFWVKIYTREQIGTYVQMEEIIENESQRENNSNTNQ